ncbi:MAG TPA: hypothetical protein VLB01_02790 [Thermodesulfobacteriota bacterium]|nr:hypothetical protein [Thermodesulfobacteriota bacterium]
MRRCFTLLAVALFLILAALVYPTEGRSENANSGAGHIIDITSNQDSISINPAIRDYSLFRDDENMAGEEGFFLPNFNIKKTINSPKRGNMRTAESLSIKSEFTPLGPLKFLGELKTGVRQTQNSETDYTLWVGHSIKIDNLKLEAYYRKNNLLVGNRSRGFFFNMNYQPLRWASFVVDVGSERKKMISNNNINVDIRSGQFKTVISPLSFASFVTGVNVSSRESGDLNNDRYTYFVRVNSKWSRYTTFIDYRFQYLDGAVDSDTDTLTAGINRIWNKIETWVKGGLAYKEARSKEDRYFGALGFNYKPFNGFNLHFENRYEKLETWGNEEGRIKFSGGVNFKLPVTLPFGMEFSNSAKLSKAVEGDANYQFMTSIVIPKL